MTSRRVLFSAQRNEGPFLLEWVAYHKVVGFTDIVIFSNDCTDGSDLLLDRLAEAGEIEHFRHDPGPDRKPQMNAARIAVEDGLFRDGDWVMWLDLDEFLYVQPGAHRVDDLIPEIEPARAVSLAWRHFGDSGNETWPGRHISKDFTMAERRHRPRPPQCKTLFRFGPEIAGLHLHRPVLTPGVTRADYPMIGGNRRPIGDLFYDTARETPWNRIDDHDKVYRLGHVIHFVARTPDLYQEKKVARGRGYREAGLGPNDRHSLDSRFNRNDVEDRSALVHEPATVREMSRLFALPGVADVCASIRWFRFDPETGAS
jgi:hypothetical protein